MCIDPQCLMHTSDTAQDIRLPMGTGPPRAASSTTSLGSLHQPSFRPPAHAFFTGDGALQGGLQAAVLVEDPDIAREDGLLAPGELAPGFLADFGRTGIPRPVGEHRPCPARFLDRPDDRHHVDLVAAIP